jgi:hypothetical protein
MSDRLLTLWLMPGPWPGSTQPDPDGFADVVRSALTVERRAAQGFLQQEDVRRHTTASIAIERIARIRGTPVATISASAIDAFRASAAAPGRAGSGFHTPAEAAGWLRGLAPLVDAADRFHLTRAADHVQAQGHGLVLSPTPSQVGPLLHLASPPVAAEARARSAPDPEAGDMVRCSSPVWEAFSRSPQRLASATRVWRQLADAVASGTPLPVGSGARHDVLAEVLRAATAVMTRRSQVRVLYVDGSEAEPFPLPTLHHGDGPEGPAIRVGLMSMRHTDQDPHIDGYWFRNRLVSTSRTLAETDAFCTAVTVSKLRELHFAGISRIELVHTGFEPAVLGFYRGLLTWLASSGAHLIVQPLYLIGRLTPGTPWGGYRGVGR